jgi:hypothetical protein
MIGLIVFNSSKVVAVDSVIQNLTALQFTFIFLISSATSDTEEPLFVGNIEK